MATHSSTLGWKIPWMEEPGRLQPMGSLRVGHDWATSLSLFTFMHWRRKWQPTQVFLPRESHRRWSLVGCNPMSQLFFAWGGQSFGVSASASVCPMNTQDWSPLGWTGWISLQSQGLSSLLQHHSSKASIFQHSAFFTVQLSHPYMTTGKTIALSYS